MVAFAPDDVLIHPADFVLLRDGPVHRGSREECRLATAELSALGYAVRQLPAGSWRAPEDLHRAVAAALDLPLHYGGDLGALHDCLGDVAEGRYGWDPAAVTGLAVSVGGYASFAAAQPHQAAVLVELAERCSRYASLFGHRILWLVSDEGGG